MNDPLHLLRELAARWREEAALYDRRGQRALVDAVNSYAAELEECLQEWALEALSLEQAAEEKGCRYDTAQRKVASGEWPNAGRKGRPAVRRCDVWPALRRPRLVTGEPDIAGEELAARG
ncbi:MAG: hypothetical protein ACE5JR_02045 [Gemmatimonadota bacterium]